MIEEARHLFQQRADGLAKRLQEAERALKQTPPWPAPPLGAPVIKDARREVAQGPARAAIAPTGSHRRPGAPTG